MTTYNPDIISELGDGEAFSPWYSVIYYEYCGLWKKIGAISIHRYGKKKHLNKLKTFAASKGQPFKKRSHASDFFSNRIMLSPT